MGGHKANFFINIEKLIVLKDVKATINMNKTIQNMCE